MVKKITGKKNPPLEKRQLQNLQYETNNAKGYKHRNLTRLRTQKR